MGTRLIISGPDRARLCIEELSMKLDAEERIDSIVIHDVLLRWTLSPENVLPEPGAGTWTRKSKGQGDDFAFLSDLVYEWVEATLVPVDNEEEG